MSWSLFNHNTVPSRYACDAFITALENSEADHVWPAESNQFDGSSPTSYVLPAFKGTDIPHYNRGLPDESFANGPAISGACQDGWYLEDTGGDAGVYLQPGIAYGSSHTATTGLVTNQAASIADPLKASLLMNYYVRANNGAVPGVCMRVTSSGGTPLIRLGNLNSTDVTDTTFASLGLDPDETHWYQLEVTASVTGGAQVQYEMQGWVDGIEINSHTMTVSSGITSVRIDSFEWLSENADGISNNLYLKEVGAVSIAPLLEAWNRNQSI